MKNLKKKADENLIALKRKEENYIAKNVVISILFSATLFIGIMVCLICNIAISGDFTWSLLPVSSIVFAWVIIFPSIILGKRGIIISFLSLSVFLVPYLFLLSNLINVKEVFSVGAVPPNPDFLICFTSLFYYSLFLCIITNKGSKCQYDQYKGRQDIPYIKNRLCYHF